MSWAQTNADAIRETNKKNNEGWRRTYELLFRQQLRGAAFMAGYDVQISNVDRIVRVNDSPFNIQEKDRRNVWDDLLVESHHEYDSGDSKDGWGRDSGLSHYLAYVMWPDYLLLPVRAYLYDYPKLATWFKDNAASLRRRYSTRKSRSNNSGYATVNIPVPMSEVDQFLIAEAHPWFDTRKERFLETSVCDECTLTTTSSMVGDRYYDNVCSIVCKDCDRFYGYAL